MRRYAFFQAHPVSVVFYCSCDHVYHIFSFSEGHDSHEDAEVTMRLALRKI